jgi:hypothetical protein
MNLASLRPRTQLILAICIPLACIIIAAALIWPSYAHIREVNENLMAAQKDIQQKKQIIKQAEAEAGGRPLALAVATDDEQEPIVYQRQLNELTLASKVLVASLRKTSPPPLPANSSYPSGSRSGAAAPSSNGAGGGVFRGERPVVPPTVRELTDIVTVEGTFGQLLDLILRLEKYDRILSVSQCRITGNDNTYPRLQAVFTLSRFVAKPVAPAPTPAAAPAPTP